MTLTDKLERMTKLVVVMNDDEEARAAYTILRREVEPDLNPLLVLASKAGVVTPGKWDHVWVIGDINDVVMELLPDSRMSVSGVWHDGFAVEWRHDCGKLLCELWYGTGASALCISVPCCKTMTLAMSQIASEYGLEFHEHIEDDEDETDEMHEAQPSPDTRPRKPKGAKDRKR